MPDEAIVLLIGQKVGYGFFDRWIGEPFGEIFINKKLKNVLFGGRRNHCPC